MFDASDGILSSKRNRKKLQNRSTSLILHEGRDNYKMSVWRAGKEALFVTSKLGY